MVGTSDDGARARIVRAREGRVEVGELRAPEEGKPMYGELIRLKPRSEDSPVCDVEVLHASPSMQRPELETRTTSKPAQVATDTYRASWDRVFGKESN